MEEKNRKGEKNRERCITGVKHSIGTVKNNKKTRNRKSLKKEEKTEKETEKAEEN